MRARIQIQMRRPKRKCENLVTTKVSEIEINVKMKVIIKVKVRGKSKGNVLLVYGSMQIKK